MALNLLRALPVVVSLAFSIVSLVFSIRAITSHEWAVRDYYNTSNADEWITPNWTMTRGLFGACAVTPIFKTITLDNGDQSTNLTSYNHSCSTYAPSGTGKTSCELRSVIKTDNLETAGDARLCQQIHYAGKFGISSTVFICLGSVLTMGLALLSAYRITTKHQPSTSRDVAESEVNQHEQKPQAVVSHSAHTTGRQRRNHHRLVGGWNFVAVLFLCIGIMLALISQFYSVLGFMQSSPNNSDFASSAADNSPSLDTNVAGFHGPWYQGTALSVYVTCAWGFALATATVAAKTWVMPTWLVSI